MRISYFYGKVRIRVEPRQVRDSMSLKKNGTLNIATTAIYLATSSDIARISLLNRILLSSEAERTFLMTERANHSRVSA